MKKALSIILAVLMLASLCTIAISSVSAEEVTINDLGVTDGDYTGVYDDPTGSGDKVLKMYAGRDNRHNYELADPTTGEAFKPVAGTVYTVKFDYYYGPATNNGSFALYYGAQSKYDTKFSKSQITSTNSGFSSKFYGDSKWHTMAMTFTAEAATGKVNGVADQPLEKLYLTYYSADRAGCVIDGYIKNIEIITETAANDVKSGTYNFDWLFTEEGTANTEYFTNTEFMTSDMTDSFVNEDGENVFVVTDKGADLKVTKSSQEVHVGDNVIVATKKSDGSISPLINRKSYYTFAIKYKVLKLGANGKASIGFGRDSTTAANCLYQYSMEQTSVSSEWQYFYATYQMTAIAGGAPITVALGGPGAHIALDSIQVISVTESNENSGVYVMNDNGEISLTFAYAGTSITKEGANAENIAMGEKFIGWSDAPTCEEVIDAYPAAPAISANAMLYAKYPTTIIDTFDMASKYKGNDDKGSSVYTFANDGGKLTMTARNTGFMLPAYASADRAYAKFVPGQDYIVTVYYDSFIGESTDDEKYEAPTATNVQIMYSDGYGTGRSRNQGTDVRKTLPSTNDTVKYSFTMPTYASSATESGNIETCMIRLNTGDGGDDKGKFTMVIDKITITDMSLTPEKDMVAVSTRAASGTGAEYVSAGIRFKAKITEDFRASATEIGFYAVPTAALNGMSLAEYVETANNIAVSAKVKADGMDEIIYAVSTDAYGRTTYDYQMILTGLTKDGETKSLCNVKMTVALYAIVDGDKVFTEDVSYSYNDFAPAQ